MNSYNQWPGTDPVTQDTIKRYFDEEDRQEQSTIVDDQLEDVEPVAGEHLLDVISAELFKPLYPERFASMDAIQQMSFKLEFDADFADQLAALLKQGNYARYGEVSGPLVLKYIEEKMGEKE